MDDTTNWPHNRLLLALPSRDLNEIKPHLEEIPCKREQVLLEADSAVEHIYFPESGVISVLAVYADGSAIEMATVGREGCTGVQPVFGVKTSSARLYVQVPGTAMRMPSKMFMQAMETLPAFHRLMFNYVPAFLEQVLVSVACNGAHSVKQRLARWLLMMRDRSDSDTLPLTQNILAEMLGIHRPTVTNAVRDLEKAQSIERGHREITIVDRGKLNAASCECYQLVRTRTAHHLPKTYA